MQEARLPAQPSLFGDVPSPADRGDTSPRVAQKAKDTTALLSVFSDVRRVALPILSVRRVAYVTDAEVAEIPLSLCSEHELTFVLDGQVTDVVGGTEITACAGECLYSAPGDLRLRKAGVAPATYLTLCFWEERPGATFASAAGISYPAKMVYSRDEDATHTVEYLIRTAQNGTPDQSVMYLGALQLLLVQLTSFVARDSENEYVRLMKTYLYSHFREGVQLADLAEHVGLHPVYCAKIFKASEGEPVGAFINRLRISRACAQLESAVETSDVAEDLGLSEFYFSRWFKQMTGITPTEYRDTVRMK